MHNICSKCPTFQLLNHKTRNYNQFPPKQAENQPYDTLCIDLIGKYQITSKKGCRKYAMKDKKYKDIYLQAFTMIDPAIGWIEIHSMPEVSADLVINQVELAWLSRYLLPYK